MVSFYLPWKLAGCMLRLAILVLKTLAPFSWLKPSSCQAGVGGAGDELDDHQIAHQRLGAPSHADEREQPVLHLLVPGGRSQTGAAMPSSLANACSARFRSRTRWPLLSPQSAVISSL